MGRRSAVLPRRAYGCSGARSNFRERGFANVTVEEITEAATLAKEPF